MLAVPKCDDVRRVAVERVKKITGLKDPAVCRFHEAQIAGEQMPEQILRERRAAETFQH